MKKLMLILFWIGVQTSSNMGLKPKSDLLLFDFENVTDVFNWEELEDYPRSRGKSRSSFCLFVTDMGQFAIFFVSLKPLPNSVTFGGSRTKTKLNLDGYQSIFFSCKALGHNTPFKIVLRHDKLNYPNPSFEQSFQVIPDSDNQINLPLSEFKPYAKRKLMKNGPTLNLKNITSFGIQLVDGIPKEKQSGTASLHIKKIWAKAFKND